MGLEADSYTNNDPGDPMLRESSEKHTIMWDDGKDYDMAQRHGMSMISTIR